MSVEADDLVTAVRAAGLRVTRPRRAVCEVVARHHAEHLTAAAIVDRVGGDADQSTVYRTLEALEDAGVLTHTHFGHGPLVYHLVDDTPHHHVVCEGCGRVEAITPDILDEVVTAIVEKTGFQVDPTHLAIAGRCPDCALREEREG